MERGAAEIKTRRRRRKNASDMAPIHWRNESDLFLLEPALSTTSTDNLWSISSETGINTTTTMTRRLRFTVRGNPLPLRRHRTSRGFVYNPSAKAQESFRNLVQAMIWGTEEDINNSNNNHQQDQDAQRLLPTPLFGAHAALAMTVIFRTKRPNTDFIGGRPGAGRMRPMMDVAEDGSVSDSSLTAPTALAPPPRTDVDNLAKFVLDSLNGLLYEDDRQIVSLQATKCRDNEGACQGSTEVYIRVVRDEDLEHILQSGMDE